MVKRHGRDLYRCIRCGSTRGVIKKYNLLYCRKCIREVYKEIGFKKYS